MYTKRLVIDVTNIDSTDLAILKQVIIAGIKKRVQYNLSDLNYGAVKFNFEYVDEDESREEPQTDFTNSLIKTIYVDFMQKVTINEINSIVSTLVTLEFVSQILQFDKDTPHPTLIRNVDGQLFRVIIKPDNPTNINQVEVLNNNPLVSKVDAYPVVISHLDFNKGQLGTIFLPEIFVNFFNIDSYRDFTTYQEIFTIPRGGNIQQYWTDLEITNEDKYEDNLQCLKLKYLPTPRVGGNPTISKWIGFINQYSLKSDIDGKIGRIFTNDLELEIVAKIPYITPDYATYLRLLHPFIRIHSGLSRIEIQNFIDYPISNNFTWSYILLDNPTDWHKYNIRLDYPNNLAYFYIDNQLKLTYNPGAPSAIPNIIHRFFANSIGTRPIDITKDYYYIQYIKTISYSRLSAF